MFAGIAIGAGTAAGSALLLYTGRGFLATAGFLLAVSLAAIAAGLWVGAPEGEAGGGPPSRRRWIWAILAYAAAGGFAMLWLSRGGLRDLALGGALAVLLILAEPAYASGSLVAALAARERAASGGSIAVIALIGAAGGVLLSTTLLIPNFIAPGIFFGMAALLAVTSVVETARLRDDGAWRGGSMNDRVVIVTGVGNRGQVGFAIARRFLDAGARVVITGFSPGVMELASELSADERVAAVQADLTNAGDVMRVMETARERFGRLDAVVNVAGGLSVIKPLAETETEEWRREIDRNAATTFMVSRAALPLLRESRGAIINFAAPAGERAVKNLGAYSAAKAAVVAMTRALALEERANGVRVNAIAPGLVDTEQNRRSIADPASARFVTREEVAEVALFLASDRASGISGETIHVLGEAIE